MEGVVYAARIGIPIVSVNQGATRGDDLAASKIDLPLGRTLAAVAAELA